MLEKLPFPFSIHLQTIIRLGDDVNFFARSRLQRQQIFGFAAHFKTTH